MTGNLDSMKGRTKQEGSDHEEDTPADTARGRGEGESRHEGKHGNPQETTMMERILAPDNLAAAWKRVKANKGAPGVDGMTIEAFPDFCREQWPRIRHDLEQGTYHPAPVRRVFIAKPDGSQRPLGVPTVLDRVIQQAIAQVLNPVFEPEFSEHSYGFREGRNAHQAVRRMEAGWKQGRRHAVDCDLKAFFDTDHLAQPGTPGAGRYRRTAALCHRMAQLLRHQPHLQGRMWTGRVGATPGAPLLLETMEATPHAQAQLDPTRCQPRGSQAGLTQPQGLLAYEFQPHRATGHDQPMARRTRGS